MTGTWINVGTVLAGSAAGASLGARLPDRLRGTLLSGLGLVTALVGAQLALKTQNVLVVLGALLVGGALGEALGLHDGLERLGRRLEQAFPKTGGRGPAEGFVTATLVFCVGPMAILGSIQDGLTGDYSLLAVKAMLDGFASVAFAASLGWGVALSAVSVLLYQGAITLGAATAAHLLTEPLVVEMSATGGLIIVGISLKLMGLKEVRLANFLPALAVAPLLAALAALVNR